MNKVVTNASWIILYKVIRAILSLVITMLTARYFGPSNFGLINYAAAIVAFMDPITQLGLNETLVQEPITDDENEGRIIGSSIVMSLCSSVLCIAGVATFTSIADQGDKTTIIVCVLYSLCLIFQAAELISYWFQWKYLSKYTSVISLIAYITVSIYRFYLLASGKSIYWFAVANAVDYAIIAGAMILFYRKLGGQKLSISFATCKSLFSRSRYYIIAGLMVTIFAQTDKIMLKQMMGDEVTGYYSAAVSCANMIGFVFAAIITSMRPMILESKKKSQEMMEKNVSRLYCIIIYGSLLVSIGMTVFAPIIIQIIYGAEYMATVNMLRVIVWYTTFAYLGTVRNVWILAEQKQRYLWIINLCGAVGNVILNVSLIPLMGGVGAAIASLITQIFTNVILGYIIAPIRKNNELMIHGLNIRYLREMYQVIRHKNTREN